MIGRVDPRRSVMDWSFFLFLVLSTATLLACVVVFLALRSRAARVSGHVRSLMVDTLPSLVFLIDDQAHLVDLNPAACKKIGLQAAQAVGQPAEKIFSNWPILSWRLKPGQEVTLPVIVQDLRGRWYDLRVLPIEYDAKSPPGWLLVIHDISAQKNIEEDYARLATVVEQADESVVITDLNGNVTYVNPYFEKKSGYSLAELHGQNMRLFRSGRQTEDDYREMWETIRSGQVWRGKFINLYKGGKYVHEANVIFPIKDSQGRVINYAALKQDITEAVNAEERLRDFARQQQLLNEITRAVIETTNSQNALDLLANRLGDLFHMDGCYITKWDERRQHVQPSSASGLLKDELSRIAPRPGEKTLTSHVLHTGKPLAVSDVHTTPHISSRLADHLPFRSALALPLMATGKKLGAVIFVFVGEHEFTREEMLVGEQAAGQVSLALLKNRLLDEARQRAAEAETIREAASVVVSSLQVQKTMRRILDELNRVVPYDSASILLVRDDELEIVAARGFPVESGVLGLRFKATSETPNSIVFRTRQPLILRDAPEAYEPFRRPPHNHIRGWMGIPLIVQERIIGMLSLDSIQVDCFTPDHARLAAAFANQVAIAIENARLFEETRRLAITDSLTGIYNRRQFMELAGREFQRSVRYKKPLSVIMFDIDFFKNINDTYGHLAGDEILRSIARTCQEQLRNADLFGRYGGEEFVILLPETSLVFCQAQENEAPLQDAWLPAQAVAERLRQAIASKPVCVGKSQISVTISLGVAERTPESPTLDAVINNADQALLKAKQAGRNRVVISE